MFRPILPRPMKPRSTLPPVRFFRYGVFWKGDVSAGCGPEPLEQGTTDVAHGGGIGHRKVHMERPAASAIERGEIAERLRKLESAERKGLPRDSDVGTRCRRNQHEHARRRAAF